MLRALPLLPLLLLAGCLYLGDRNDAPRVTISTSVTRVHLGEPVEIDFDFTDDADHDLNVELQVRDERGAAPDACRFQQVSHAHSTTFTFYGVGTYRIGGFVRDHLGAVGTAGTIAIEVVNAAPRFGFPSSLAFMSGTGRCNLYTAGEPVVLAFVGSVSDADAALGNPGSGPDCHDLPTLAYGWRVSKAPPDSTPQLTAYLFGGCLPRSDANGPVLATSSPNDRVCLWTTEGDFGDYAVQFFASDQANPEIEMSTTKFTFADDSPPCISGESPVADHFIVDHTRPQRLQVTGIEDDRDPYGSDKLHYVWSVWRQSDPDHWYVVPDHRDSDYVVDPLDFTVGEELRVRVEVVDRTNRTAGDACDIMADDCLVQSCTVPTTAPLQTCRKWRTWVLEPR
jgi:hypothetical protein